MVDALIAFGWQRSLVFVAVVASLFVSIGFLWSNEAHPRAMIAAYLLSAIFWTAASFAADLAQPLVGTDARAWPKPQMSNLANALAAGLAAVGTTASVENGWATLLG